MSGAGEGGNAVTRSHYCNAIFMGGDRRHTSFGVFLLSSSLKSVNMTTWCGGALLSCNCTIAAGPGVTQHCPCH